MSDLSRRSTQCIEHYTGVFTLADTETQTETDEKWLVWNCVEGFILLKRQRPMQISIGFCTHFIDACKVNGACVMCVHLPNCKKNFGRLWHAELYINDSLLLISSLSSHMYCIWITLSHNFVARKVDCVENHGKCGEFERATRDAVKRLLLPVDLFIWLDAQKLPNVSNQKRRQ